MWSIAQMGENASHYRDGTLYQNMTAAPSGADPSWAWERELFDFNVYMAALIGHIEEQRKVGLAFNRGDLDHFEFGYRGPQCHVEMNAGEFEYVRYRGWYAANGSEGVRDPEMHRPHEVRCVGRSYAKWMAEHGIVRILTEAEATAENDYLRRYVRGTWREETIDHEAERTLAAIEVASDRVERAMPILAAILERKPDAELSGLIESERWCEVIDALGGLPATVKKPNMVSQSEDWKLGRICIGGKLHGVHQWSNFHSFPPKGYLDAEIREENGDLFMLIWAHRSLSDEKRCKRFGEWLSSYTKEAA